MQNFWDCLQQKKNNKLFLPPHSLISAGVLQQNQQQQWQRRRGRVGKFFLENCTEKREKTFPLTFMIALHPPHCNCSIQAEGGRRSFMDFHFNLFQLLPALLLLLFGMNELTIAVFKVFYAFPCCWNVISNERKIFLKSSRYSLFPRKLSRAISFFH